MSLKDTDLTKELAGEVLSEQGQSLYQSMIDVQRNQKGGLKVVNERMDSIEEFIEDSPALESGVALMTLGLKFLWFLRKAEQIIEETKGGD